MKSLV